MVSASATISARRGLTRLGRIEGSPSRYSLEPPERKRSGWRHLRRLLLVAALLPPVGLAVWFFHFRIVALAVVEGQTFTLVAPAPVVIEEVLVEPGQWCREDEPLVRLAAKDIDTKRRMLEAQVAQERLRYEMAVQGAELGEVRLGGRLDDRDRLATETRTAEADVASAQAEYDDAEQERERYLELQQRGQAAEQEVAAAKTTALTAAAKLHRAQAYLDGLRTVSARYDELVPVNTGGGELRELELAFLRAAVEAAEQRLRNFEFEAGSRWLVAPFDGRIDQVYVTPGAHRHPDAALVTLFDPASLYVTAYLDPADQDRVAVGSTVKMYPKGSWKPFHGTVTQVHAGWSRIPSSVQGSTEEIVPAITARIEADAAGRERLAPNMILRIVLERT